MSEHEIVFIEPSKLPHDLLLSLCSGASLAGPACESQAATAGVTHAGSACKSDAKAAGGTHAGITDEFPYKVKVYMTQSGGHQLHPLSVKGDTIGAILCDLFDHSQYTVRYGRDFAFCILCLRTKQDADSVVTKLHNKKVELPKKVNLSAEHVDEKVKQKVPKDKAASAPAPAPAAPGKRYVLVKVQSDTGDNMPIRPHDVPFLLWVFGTCPTSETAEEVSLKSCHHVCKRDFLWLKFESEEKAQLAIKKMHGQEFIRDEYDESTYTVVVESTDLKF